MRIAYTEVFDNSELAVFDDTCGILIQTHLS